MKRTGVWSLVKLGGVVLVGAAAAIPTAAMTETPADAGGAADISGSYSIKGEGGGTNYTGSATISHIGGSMYKGKWTIGDNTFFGVAFVDDDDVSCGWALKASDANVVAYLVKDDGLDGVWFEEGDTALGIEYLKPAKGKMAANLGGSYTIGSVGKDGQWVKKGKFPSGKEYTGTVAVKQLTNIAPNVYSLDWTIGGAPSKGVGVRNMDNGEDDIISVGFTDGGKEFGALQYNIQKNGKILDGEWVQSINGKVSAGTEKLTKL